MWQMNQIRRLEISAELDVTPGPGGEPILFRIDVFSAQTSQSSSALFTARVFRRDCFRLVSTFHTSEAKDQVPFADHEMFVLDPMFGSLDIPANTSEEALRVVLRLIEAQLTTHD